MLEAIADFWKPTKRAVAAPRLSVEELQIGSAIGFGFVPQPSLAGRRLSVTAINTYQFGPDILTSFVLSQERDAGASMILAESKGEQYVAMSRRISISDRNKMFRHEEIEAAVTSVSPVSIACHDMIADYKGWLASAYQRETGTARGRLYRGDHRAGILTGEQALEFDYALLVSDTHEHALEIERYLDGRIEVYATVYRRMSDIGEVMHPDKKEMARSEVKLVSTISPSLPPVPPKIEPKFETAAPIQPTALPASLPVVEEASVFDEPYVEKPMVKPVSEDVPKPVVSTQEHVPETKPTHVQEHAVTSRVMLPEFSAADLALKAAADTDRIFSASAIIQTNAQPFIKQEIKAVNKEPSNFVSESIDCELQVANTIINEAIRNEMRINDVVRRVIGLPVSQQESVQIPIILTDQDYALLAIRYGISASDREAIKKRIIDDLGDFSGANKLKKVA